MLLHPFVVKTNPQASRRRWKAATARTGAPSSSMGLIERREQLLAIL
jgi:hypothetical protein